MHLIQNLSSICKQKFNKIPNWQTIQDVIEQLVRNIRKYIVKALISSKMFYKYRHNKAYQLLVDATGLSSYDYNLNVNCISRNTKTK